MLSPQIQQILSAYRAELLPRFGHRLRRLSVFGSWARGEATEDSDLDVAVVIDGLTGEEWKAALSSAADVEVQHDFPFSAFIVSSERFERLRPLRGIVEDIERGSLRVDSDVRDDVDAELQHADFALRAAEALLGLNLPSEAPSRIYSAVFHAARALLFSIGIAPRSHEAVRSLISQHFVKTGKLPAECSKDLPQLEGLRTAGDYDPHFALGVKELQPELERARRFIADARKTLGKP